MKVSLCLLVWNELEGCRHDVPLLPLASFDEVYAVDGGSTDGTVAYLKAVGVPVYQQPKHGLNNAYIHARECSSCDAVVVFFPKGTIDPGVLTEFRPRLEAGDGVVTASRMIDGGRNEEDGRIFRPRKCFVLGLACLASALWRREGNMVWDVLHGVKAFSNAAFDAMDILDTGLSIDIEMVARSYKLHIPRSEFPVQEYPRVHGGTHFKAWGTGKRLLRYIWTEIGRPAGTLRS
jgi:glycosyltransferase involved in cell wall biosynthesis